MDPHGVASTAPRVGRLPEQVLETLVQNAAAAPAATPSRAAAPGAPDPADSAAANDA